LPGITLEQADLLHHIVAIGSYKGAAKAEQKAEQLLNKAKEISERASLKAGYDEMADAAAAAIGTGTQAVSEGTAELDGLFSFISGGDVGDGAVANDGILENEKKPSEGERDPNVDDGVDLMTLFGAVDMPLPKADPASNEGMAGLVGSTSIISSGTTGVDDFIGGLGLDMSKLTSKKEMSVGMSVSAPAPATTAAPTSLISDSFDVSTLMPASESSPRKMTARTRKSLSSEVDVGDIVSNILNQPKPSPVVVLNLTSPSTSAKANASPTKGTNSTVDDLLGLSSEHTPRVDSQLPQGGGVEQRHRAAQSPSHTKTAAFSSHLQHLDSSAAATAAAATAAANGVVLPEGVQLNYKKTRGNYVWDSASGLWFSLKTGYFFKHEKRLYSKNPFGPWLRFCAATRMLVPA